MTDHQISPPFTHEKNITVGNGRVIYGPYQIGADSMNVWHLPGGAITHDQFEAHACAVRMDRLMGGGN